ncbi:hypothetical protein [Rhodococcus ruber]|uniref:hypothetical protein n=1 Tax=Rhodococcus ruber TaxID=1830 RepID=UPI003D81B6D8
MIDPSTIFAEVIVLSATPPTYPAASAADAAAAGREVGRVLRLLRRGGRSSAGNRRERLRVGQEWQRRTGTVRSSSPVAREIVNTSAVPSAERAMSVTLSPFGPRTTGVPADGCAGVIR